jgi:membrane protein DedA with SNARE-associated domain
MNLNSAATLVAVSALIGYFLMRFLLPTLHYERLVLLGSLALVSIFLMFLYRRQKPKKEMSKQADARKQTN